MGRNAQRRRAERELAEANRRLQRVRSAIEAARTGSGN